MIFDFDIFDIFDILDILGIILMFMLVFYVRKNFRARQPAPPSSGPPPGWSRSGPGSISRGVGIRSPNVGEREDRSKTEIEETSGLQFWDPPPHGVCPGERSVRRRVPKNQPLRGWKFGTRLRTGFLLENFLRGGGFQKWSPPLRFCQGSPGFLGFDGFAAKA